MKKRPALNLAASGAQRPAALPQNQHQNFESEVALKGVGGLDKKLFQNGVTFHFFYTFSFENIKILCRQDKVDFRQP